MPGRLAAAYETRLAAGALARDPAQAAAAQALFARGVTLVATSNRPPDDLYRDDLNRQLFLPFIALLKDRLDIVPVMGALDYRRERLRPPSPA